MPQGPGKEPRVWNVTKRVLKTMSLSLGPVLFWLTLFPFLCNPFFLWRSVYSGSNRVLPTFSVHPLIPDQLWGLLPLIQQAAIFISKGLRLEDTFIQPADGIKTFHPSAQVLSQLRAYPNLFR